MSLPKYLVIVTLEMTVEADTPEEAFMIASVGGIGGGRWRFDYEIIDDEESEDDTNA